MFTRLFLSCLSQLLVGWKRTRKGWCQASQEDSSRQHSGYYKARYPSSGTSWRCEAYLRSHLRRDPWCLEDLPRKCGYRLSRGCFSAHIDQVIRDSVTYTEHAKRKTVTALDVVYALKRSGRTLYGFGYVLLGFLTCNGLTLCQSA